ncbi:hypothetical protein FKV25_05135 [Lysobacter aestuarii]|uniref:Uncharacterized protein n=1 Tax=Marilutibacter aestuarii TaxID=1706195 RepID=A0A508AFZ9_9GAMM|nr:hypothetical protein FKV25_05135 [Lysobacter aestuarii]
MWSAIAHHAGREWGGVWGRQEPPGALRSPGLRTGYARANLRGEAGEGQRLDPSVRWDDGKLRGAAHSRLASPRIPNPQSPIPNPESRIPNPESRIPNPESGITNYELRITSPPPPKAAPDANGRCAASPGSRGGGRRAGSPGS